MTRLTFLYKKILLTIGFIGLSASLIAQVVAGFSAIPVSGCAPLVVRFTDQSTGNPTSWQWDLGNGAQSTQQNPTTTYFNPGTYTVTLTATNTNGSNTLTRTAYITVFSNPTISFTASNTQGCFPLRVQFTDQSTPGSGVLTAWEWDFGDGNTSTLQNPFHIYTQAGNFNVTLKATNDRGCTRIFSRQQYISVSPGVKADFSNTLPTVCRPPASISFTNLSTGPGTITYLWTFGDATSSNLTNPNHTYTNAGTYSVALIAQSSLGCVDTITKNNLLAIGNITTSFNAPDSICALTNFTLTNTSSPAPISAAWTFGDATTSSLINPVKSYTNPGTYQIRLINTYANCSDSAFRTIRVLALPVANFSAPDSVDCRAPFTVNFQNNSIGAVSWQWNFGDGNSSNLQNPSHTYTSAGNYTVTLTVTNASGCTANISKTNFVRINAPVVGINGVPVTGCVPFVFNPTSNVTALEGVASYFWDFGNGSTSTLQNPGHTYNTQGTYTVKLIITTNKGCTDSAVVPAAVRVGTVPVVDFSAAPNPVCAFAPIQFTDLSAPADTWLWNFGDGFTSTLQNPVHNYFDTGRFTISLSATNNGCTRTLTRPAYVTVLPPVARFGFAINCNNKRQVSFTDQSILATTWLWNFGDGNTSTAQNPVHTYATLGTYLVTLTVTNGTCSNTYPFSVKLSSEIADFNKSTDSICRGNAITFTAINSNPANVNFYEWDFGDGTTVVGPRTISHTYNTAGTFNVRLIIVESTGCKDTATKFAYIRVNGPTADFQPAQLSACKGTSLNFNDLSTSDGVNPIVEWTWNWGDGSIQTLTSPPFSHTYNIPLLYSVILTVRDSRGCTDTRLRPNLITVPDPRANFFSPDTLACPNSLVNFINQSSAVFPTYTWEFGDGNTSSTINTTHNYTAPGLYTVKLRLRDTFGCLDSMVKPAYIRVANPIAGFTMSDSITSCPPLQVDFGFTGQFYNTYFWDFGNGQTSTTVQNPSITYINPGVYNVKLRITGPGGCQDSIIKQIQIFDTTGTRLVYNPFNGCLPLNVNFTAITQGPVNYLWDFNDGQTTQGTLGAITHSYTSPGKYLPKVILEDPTGCLIPVTGTDTIYANGAKPKFGFSQSLFCDSGTVQFTDSTISNELVTNYFWNFGDGSFSNNQSPTHTYRNPGIYSVKLVVNTQSGCRDSSTLTNIIKVVARPNITITGDSTGCPGVRLQLTGAELVADTSALAWAWAFGNGGSSRLQTPPPQLYSASGNYVAQLVAVNSSGCRDTALKNIQIFNLPAITLPPSIIVPTGSSQALPATYGPGVTSYAWTPNTWLDCTNCSNPVTTPRSNITYLVRATDQNGCSDTASVRIILTCNDKNVFIPNTFSPNGDGVNDVFYPRGKGLFSIKSIRVFNRWGELVFQKLDAGVNDPSMGWNGNLNGRPAEADVYTWLIEIICDNAQILKYQGNISLIR